MEQANEILLSNKPPLPLIIILIPILIILFSTIYILKKQNKNRAAATFPLPPGPWKLPIIGNIHQLAFSSALIHRRLAELAEQYGPVMQLKLGETSNVVLSSPEAATEYLRTHDQNFSIRPHMPTASILFYSGKSIAFSSDGEHWRRMRKLLAMELLSEKRVKSLRPIRDEEIGKLMKVIGSEPAGGAVNLNRLLVSVGNAMTSRTAFGKVRELESSFLPVARQILKAVGGFNIGDIFPSNRLLLIISGAERRLKKIHQEADVILQGLIDEHVSRRRRETEYPDTADDDEDLVDMLLAYTNYNHVEVKAIIMDIFVAGGDTSPLTVEWVMSELMRNPEKMVKVQREVRQLFDKRGKVVDEACIDELQYLKSVVKETFRLHPLAPLSVPKEGREAVAINGYQIPTKTRVIVNYWAIARDSSHWTNPDQFIPERFLDTYIDYKGFDSHLFPFGGGRRVCPGMDYGIAVVYALLMNLLYHFDWKLPNQLKPQDLDMSEDFGVTVSRKNNLYLIPIPYHGP
ncbi:unnamed protein product [Linum trigynum]|uniref:Cytochrome P450 n=1 Tax=Linum trigynum TaxID=586398 RepID=A0AAV2C917_9ROSI